jgi:hypothetical protein
LLKLDKPRERYILLIPIGIIFITGVKFGPGTYLLEGVGLTDKVPMFLREGFAVVKQDTIDIVI